MTDDEAVDEKSAEDTGADQHIVIKILVGAGAVVRALLIGAVLLFVLILLPLKVFASLVNAGASPVWVTIGGLVCAWWVVKRIVGLFKEA